MLQFLTGASRAATGWVAKRGRHLPAVFNCKRYSSEFSNDVTGYGADLQEISKEYSAPHLWYPGARRKKRKIIAHVGPTNSGKTHTAVQKLITNPDLQGLYCSPLRLLAWETFERLNANGAKTNLMTGQERDIRHEDARVLACTVEMAETHREFDIAIIDEIQMIGVNAHRGHGWTRALLGIQASEIHVCGEERTVPLLEKICESMGEELEVNYYERLSPLDYESEPALRSYHDLRPGDAVVAFKRRDLYTIKRQIERETGRKCCIIYGALPPAVRKDQAKRFNTPNNGYDILVATDAVGMGLNLAIGRVVFESMVKFNGKETVELRPDEVRQIGGRAGRYKSEFPKGFVTCRRNQDVVLMRKKMSEDVTPVAKAFLQPTLEQISAFARSKSMMTFQSSSALLSGTVEGNPQPRTSRSEYKQIWADFQREHSSASVAVSRIKSHYTSGGSTVPGQQVTVEGKATEVQNALGVLSQLMYDGDFPGNEHHAPAGEDEIYVNEEEEFFLGVPRSAYHNITSEFLDDLREKFACKIVCDDDFASAPDPLIYCRATRPALASVALSIGERMCEGNSRGDSDTSFASLSTLLQEFEEGAKVDSDIYQIGDLKDMKELAELLEHFPLPLELRFLLCHAPVNCRSDTCKRHFIDTVKRLLKGGDVRLHLKLPEQCPNTPFQLMLVEDIYKAIDVYLWLSMKFEEEFVDRELAIKTGEKAIEMMTKYLEKAGKKKKKKREKKLGTLGVTKRRFRGKWRKRE
jgi:hypothetical protein